MTDRASREASTPDARRHRTSKPHSAEPAASAAPAALAPGSPVAGVVLRHLGSRAGNAAVGRALVQMQRGETTATEKSSQAPSEKELDRIQAMYEAMIEDARKQGRNVAADNLQRFLDGTGGTKQEDVGWLRGNSAVTSAERTNQTRFELSLKKIAYELADGEKRTFKDYWDRQLTASTLTELYYASGTSTITSTGSFELHKKGNTITVTGSVEHRWWDPYDWHPGLKANVPGHGVISDADAKLLEKHRGAKPFDMEAKWTQKVTGTVREIDWWPDEVTFEWSGP